MIQDSHVVALHISLRCVEVAATMRRSCVGQRSVLQHDLDWRPRCLLICYLNVFLMS